MSAFLQVLRIRFAGRHPGRPRRCGRSFQRGRFMPRENLGGSGSRVPGTAGNRIGVSRTTLRRSRPSQPRDRRNGARRLLGAAGLVLGPCSTGSGTLLRCFPRAGIRDLR